MDARSQPASTPPPAGLPVMLNLRGRRCVIVGGGATAARRAATLVQCGAQVTVIAPCMDERLDGLMIQRAERRYEAGDLDAAFLVVVATNDPAVNEQVAADAAAAGALTNRADAPLSSSRKIPGDTSGSSEKRVSGGGSGGGGGDLTVMGYERRGPLTVAVDTGQSSPSAGKAIRREIMEKLDPDWAALLDAARPWRAKVQAAVSDPATRTTRLRQLTDAAAMKLFKLEGRDALNAHLKEVAAGTLDPA